MITLIARFKMREGKEEEALAEIRRMVSAVEANEPGVLAYICQRSISDPSEVIFFENYQDQAALDAHGKTEHMAALGSRFVELFDVQHRKIERLERVAGFARGG